MDQKDDPMKIAQFREFGVPEEVLSVIEVEEPVAGPGQALIHVEASPVHIADLKFMSAVLPFHSPLPGTPGMEGIGRILKTGPGVTAFKEGDRVFLPVRVGGHGGWRQKVVLDEADLMPAPEGDARQLCLTPINGATAWTVLRFPMTLKAGDWIYQTAANSNCGRYIITLAKRMGIKTINVVRRESLAADLYDLGADVVLVDGDDLVEQVQAATGGEPVKMCIDCVAGMATQKAADVVEYGGLILSYGMLSGDPCMVRPDTMFGKALKLHGYMTNQGLDALNDAEKREMYGELAELISAGTLSADIAASYTLDEVKDAVIHAAQTGTDRPGKIIILPNGAEGAGLAA